MRKFLAVLVALASVVVLSSCTFGPFKPPYIQGDDDPQRARDRMEQIADALGDQDGAALKGMFSAVALEQATEIDEELEYLLSLFPEGEISWEKAGSHSFGAIENGKKTTLLRVIYRVTADGGDFWLFFADFTENTIDPENVGLYGLGVAPRTESEDSEAEKEFYSWNGQFGLDEKGTPGIYVPQ